MLNITLSLNDTQLNLISGYNGINANAELDFQDYLSSQIDSRLLPLYRDYVRNKQINQAAQIVDLNLVDRMQGIIDIIKSDDTATYTITVGPDSVSTVSVIPAPIEEIP